MSLESLANELLLDLFEYLDVINLFRAFHHLNNRFDQLLLIQHQRYYLDFRSISKHDLDIFCQQYLSSISTRIISLHLSDDVEITHLPQIVLSNGYHINEFIHLRSLSIDHSYSFELLNQITSQCRELIYLTHLSITINNNEDPEENFRNFIKNIWSLPNLTHCYLDITYPYVNWLLKMSIISPSINYLSLKNMYYNSDSLSQLFKHTPHLQRLHIGKMGEFNHQQGHCIFPLLISLNMIVESSILCMKNLFQKTPNLCYLTLQINTLYLNGQEWEKILRNYLKNIKVFRLKMTMEFSPSEDLEEQVDQLLDSFRSHYWIEKHHWFVRCDYYPRDINKTGLLYTLPYAFDTFYYIDGSRSKSTSANDLDYSLYNRVETLHHTARKQDFSENWISSPIRFVNIRYLKMKFPFNDQFWSVLPTLDRLITLDATLNQDLGYAQLQMLLDRAPRLHSLSFCHMKNFSMNSFNVNSKSIHQLKFVQNFGYRLRYFNTEECAVLARSSLASQCQVLTIDVESRTNMLELIQTMSNLRVLSVQCNYEQNHQHESSEKNEDLIKWLEDRSPFKYTYLTVRDFYGNSHINLSIHRTS